MKRVLYLRLNPITEKLLLLLLSRRICILITVKWLFTASHYVLFYTADWIGIKINYIVYRERYWKRKKRRFLIWQTLFVMTIVCPTRYLREKHYDICRTGFICSEEAVPFPFRHGKRNWCNRTNNLQMGARIIQTAYFIKRQVYVIMQKRKNQVWWIKILYALYSQPCLSWLRNTVFK